MKIITLAFLTISMLTFLTSCSKLFVEAAKEISDVEKVVMQAEEGARDALDEDVKRSD